MLFGVLFTALLLSLGYDTLPYVRIYRDSKNFPIRSLYKTSVLKNHMTYYQWNGRGRLI